MASLDKDQDRYRVRWRTPDGKQHTKRFDRQAEARSFRAAIETELEALRRRGGQQRRLSDLAQVWIDELAAHGREPLHIRNCDGHIRLHILPYWLSGRGGGDPLIDSLRPSDIFAFRDWLLRDRSANLTRAVMKSLSSMLRVGVRRDWLPANPAAAITVNAPRRARGTVDVFDPAEVRRIMLAATTWRQAMPCSRDWLVAVRAEAVLALSFYAGLRPSEWRGLSAEAVDLTGGIVDIRQRADARGTIGPPKSEAGRRRLYLSPGSITALRRYRAARWWGRQRGLIGGSLLFSFGDKPMNESNWADRSWKPILHWAGVRYLHPYSARHWYASRLIAAGETAKEVQERMGHGSIQITYDTYGHLFRDAETESRRRRMAAAIEV